LGMLNTMFRTICWWRCKLTILNRWPAD
jgi:hypothetical protein